MAQDIEIYIEKIVLDGFDGMNVKYLKNAIQEHLTSLFLEQGFPDGLSKSTDHGKLNGGQIDMGANPKTDGLGSEIAGGIYRGIKSIT
jgi:hypothetical protein